MRIAIPNLLMRRNHDPIAFEIEEELQFHIEMLERKYAQHGMSAAEAKAAAVKRFGNFERIKKQCVHITRRNSVLRRILKSSLILIALTGLSIQILSTDYKVDRIGHILVMNAILGRLLLYVRALGPSTFFSRTKVTETLKIGRS